MTMEEERKLRHRIALLLSTKPSYVYIEKTEELKDKKRHVYANVNGYKYGVLMDGDRIEQMWRVTA